MRKFISILVLFVCVSCLDTTEKVMNKYIIGFSQCTTNDDWRKTMNEEMLREIRLTRNYDIELVIMDAHDNSETQIDDIRELVDQGIDLLIVSPNEAEPLTPVIEETFDKGIPVITIDRNINSDKYTAYIGANNYDIGKEAGLFAVELLNKKGKIIEISGLDGSTPAIERTIGFLDAIRNFPEIQLIKRIDGNWGMEKARLATDSLFGHLREFDLIYAHNDVMAYGAYVSAQKYGLDPYIIGIDGLNNFGVQYVLDGYLDGTFLYPTGGDRAIQLAIDILNDRKFERFTYLNTLRIDQSNARVTTLQGEKIFEQQARIDNLDTLLSDYSTIIQKKNTFLFLTTSIIILILLLAGLVFYMMLHKNRLNKELDGKHKIISKQNKTITDQRDDLIKMLKITEETKETKLQLLTNIYHEFRNVLTIIIPPIQELLHIKFDDKCKEELSIVSQGTNRLLRLSEEILNYTKTNTNKLKLVYRNVNISKFIKNIVDVFNQKAGEKEIALTLDIQPNIHLYCDVTVIEKVVYNLLANAIHYTHEHGKITVKVMEDEMNVSIKVRDNGIGISSSDLPHIFTRMYRVNNSKRKSLQDDGTGIGLAFSKELIQLHGGQISVTSNKNEFTEFDVLIPKLVNNKHVQDYKGGLSNAIQIDPSNGDKIKPLMENTVLIVEDNPDILKIISNIVGKDYNVITAANGQKGLDLAIIKTPDIIVSDILMPIMDGITMCIMLKKNPITSHIPIIILTAVDSTDTNIKGLEVGADSYITKPFSENLLLTAIQNLIQKRDRFKDIFGFSKFIGNFTKTKEKEDHIFIDKCIRTIFENIDNEFFSIDNLAELMNTSRSSFYKKIKRITNKRAVDFVKESKLYYASKLLLNKNLSIHEIAWKSGFSDVKYFSKCFAKQYGCSPSVFRIKVDPNGPVQEKELIL